MKKIISKFLVFSFTIFTILPAYAESFGEASEKVFEKYGIPCIVGLAGGYVVDHDKGIQMGAVACTVVFTYGEFGRGSQRTITPDDVTIIESMINKESAKLSQKIHEEYDPKIEALGRKVLDESVLTRQSIRNSVTDLGIFLEKDLSEKIDKSMENPKLVQDLDSKINMRVKEEIQSEFRSKEREIVDMATEKTIKRVIAEPIVPDRAPKADSPK